jgi:hypothetical protein
LEKLLNELNKMKACNKIGVIALMLLYGTIHAQIGIGTSKPDTSSLLDLNSNSKGFLPPRLSETEKVGILMPASGLVVFNTTTNDLETNTGTPLLPNWKGTKGGYETVTASDNSTTTSLIAEIAGGMILTPVAGIYSVTFNSQFNNAQQLTTTPQIVLDLETLYNELKAKPATNTSHGPVFGNATTVGEVLTPGVYTLVGATSLETNVTLDAGGNSNALFIVRVDGAFTAAAGATIILANGALAKNVFWVIDGAIGFAAGTIMKGVVISHGFAIAGASGVDLEGRFFSTTGAISFGPGTAAIPSGTSQINLGLLAPYVLFSSNGDLANTAVSNYTGDIGTVQGLVSGYSSAIIKGNIHLPSSFNAPGLLIDNNNKVLATFGIYQNGVLIPSSTKALISTANASNISLQAIAAVELGEPIEVRWKTGSDKIIMGNRTLTVIKIQ